MGRPVDSDEVKAIIQRICKLCGEYKKYDGVMCGACVMDGLEDEIDELPTIPTPTGTATTWATAEDGTVDSMEVTYYKSE